MHRDVFVLGGSSPVLFGVLLLLRLALLFRYFVVLLCPAGCDFGGGSLNITLPRANWIKNNGSHEQLLKILQQLLHVLLTH